ncbi:MAG: serine/threonine-protein phosphatase [Pyrinomonadaceae bacterium]|nr:serine/threonine-protein phosphatase [Pyrinomonadaceae bacterium]
MNLIRPVIVFILLDKEHVGVAIADVAGKGISASLVMSNVQAALRSQTLAHRARAKPMLSLAELVSNINVLICRSTGPATYVTFFYAQFDEQTQQLTYVNAGHNPPLLLHATEPELHYQAEARAALKNVFVAGRPNNNGESEAIKLSVGGPVLGVFEGCRY